LKDFEVLQKTDPEAALQQLEQLERTRAEERVSLRHRSTGQWARNKAVRAKYDKEVSIPPSTGSECVYENDLKHNLPIMD
jgi:U3 small nucleolar RNA-associated protein 14